MSQIVIRRNLKTSEEIPEEVRYEVLKLYSEGRKPKQIATDLKLNHKSVSQFIDQFCTSVTAIKETNKLTTGGAVALNKDPLPMMNTNWLADAEQNAEQYAYYYATTGSNTFALEESQLDKHIPSSTSARAKSYILQARGRYLRSVPEINTLINTYRDQKVKDSDVGSSFVQSELLQQLDELKELAAESPRYRGHLLNVIKMLGQSEGVFSETVNVNDTSAKTGMDLLMAKVKEREEKVEYEHESRAVR